MNRRTASVSEVFDITCPLLVAGLLFLVSSGCRKTADPPPAATTKAAPPARPKRPEQRPEQNEAAASPNRESRKPADRSGSESTAGREPGKSDGAKASAGATGESEGVGADGATGAADRGGASYDGTWAPKTPEESIQIAGLELKSSGTADAKGDLASAVRHAARALQAAGAFPKDPKCVVLADAARGRLKALEGKGVSPGDLSRSGPLDTRRIIESP